MDIGVQTKNVIRFDEPLEGFMMLKRAGFSCCDFSLNACLTSDDLYRQKANDFFDRPAGALRDFFAPCREAAQAAGIRISQMHMPYPMYVPEGKKEWNDYLFSVAAPKSMEICAFMECPYIVVHGFKLSHYLGSEEAEWEKTSEFLESLAPMAKELGICLCVENLYTSVGGHIVEGPCCDARKAAKRIDEMNERFGGEVLGFCFDTGHANLVGIDFEDFIAALGHRLKVLHIHDNDGCEDLHQIPFTFTRSRENLSSTDWGGFVRGLRRLSFDGVLNFETAPVLTAFPEVMKQDVLRLIADIGTYFAGEIRTLSSVGGGNRAAKG